MKIPRFTFGTSLSLLGHLVLLQGVMLFVLSGESTPLRSEVIEVELVTGGVGDASVAASNVMSLRTEVAPSTAESKLNPPPQKKESRPARYPQSAKRPRSEPAVSVSSPDGEQGPREMSAVSPSGGLSIDSGAGVDSHAVRTGYGSQLVSWINRFKLYPSLARRRGIEGDAKVRLVIQRSGTLLSSSLFVASGSALLDEGALAMVKAASPFPPVPTGLAGEHFEFEVPISFRLR